MKSPLLHSSERFIGSGNRFIGCTHDGFAAMLNILDITSAESENVGA